MIANENDDDEDDEFFSNIPDIMQNENNHPHDSNDLATKFPTFSILSLASSSSSSTSTSSNITLQWKVYDKELIYSIPYVPIHHENIDTLKYLNRLNHEAYVQSCNQSFTLPLFPVDSIILQKYFPFLIKKHEYIGSLLSTNQPNSQTTTRSHHHKAHQSSGLPQQTTTTPTKIQFREEFYHLSRLIKSIRIQKIVLYDKITKLKSNILKCQNFLELCELKLQNQLTRLKLLENELVVYEPYDSYHPSNIFTTFLLIETGWMTTITYLIKEYRYGITQLQEKEKENEKEDEKEKEGQLLPQQQEEKETEKEKVKKMEQDQEKQEQEQQQEEKDEKQNLISGKELEKILQRQGFGFNLQMISEVFLLLKYWQLIITISIRAFVEKDSIYRTYCRYTTTTTSSAGASASGSDQKSEIMKSLSSLNINEKKKKKKKLLTKNQLKKTLSLAPAERQQDGNGKGVTQQQQLLQDEEEDDEDDLDDDLDDLSNIKKKKKKKKEEDEKKEEEEIKEKKKTIKESSSFQIKKQNSSSQQHIPLKNPLLPCGNICLVPWNEICKFLNIPIPSSYTSAMNQENNSNLEYEDYQSLLLAIKAIIDIFTWNEQHINTNTNTGTSATSASANSPRPSYHENELINYLIQTQKIKWISKANLSNIIFYYNELTSATSSSMESTPLIESTRMIGLALLNLVDDLGKILEEIFLEPYRRLNIWTSILENMRKARVKKEGGQLVLRDNGAVEVDEQGAIRIIPNADEIVDTDILHGSRQRIRIQIAIPQAKYKLQLYQKNLFLSEGELSCLTQFGYSIVSPYIQRVVRGIRIRKQVQKYLKRNLIYYAIHAAAVLIQCCYRALKGRQRYLYFIQKRKYDAVVKIQKIIRGVLGRKVGNQLAEIRHQQYINKGALELQRLVRGFLARRKVQKILQQAQEEKAKDNRLWGALTIQRIARGYIARNTIIRSHKIRKNLSVHVLKLAERYICGPKGDLWGFLKEVDENLKRFSKNIEEIQQREQEMAETFVSKVLSLRQSNFDTAWNDFAYQQALKQPTNGPEISYSDSLRSSSPLPSPTKSWNSSFPLATSMHESTLSLIEPIQSPAVFSSHLSPFHGKNTTQPQSTLHLHNGIQTQIPPPGPLLRKAVATTMRGKTLTTTTDTKVIQKSKIIEIEQAYAMKDEKKKRKNRNNQSLQSNPNRSPPPKTSTKRNLTANKYAATEEKTKISQLSKSYLNPIWIQSQGFPSESQNQLHNPSPSSSSSPTHISSIDRIHKKSTILRDIDAGQSLLIDIPNGINDKIDRLIYASSIRCHVPDELFGSAGTSTTSSGTDLGRGTSATNASHITPHEAYQYYLSFPSNSLAKIRYEQLIYQWCQPYINRLRLKGILFIKDALPVSKLNMFLRNIETPLELINSCQIITKQLLQLTNFSQGFLINEFQKDLQNIQNDQAKVTIAIKAGRESSSSPSSPSPSPSPTLGVSTSSPLPSQSSPQPSHQPQPQPSSPSHPPTSTSDSDPAILQMAQQFLEKMISLGEWSHMDSSIELLLQHAAFLICPHDPSYDESQPTSMRIYRGDIHQPRTLYGLFDNPDEDIHEEETIEELRCGHLAFQSFTIHLLQQTNEIDLKNLIRQRYRAAVILSTPYELQFKNLGIMTVHDLIHSTTMTSSTTSRNTTQRNLDHTSMVSQIYSSMLKPYREQVEALLSMVISIHVESKVLPITANGANIIRSTAITKTPHDATQITPTGPLIDNPRLIQVPLAFDPKFQRGPLDPYGRPARIVGQLPALKPPSSSHHTSTSNRTNILSAHHGSIQPLIGTNDMNELTSNYESNKRKNNLQRDLQTSHGPNPHYDIQEMYESLPNNIWERTQSANSNELNEMIMNPSTAPNTATATATLPATTPPTMEDDLTHSMYHYDPQMASNIHSSSQLNTSHSLPQIHKKKSQKQQQQGEEMNQKKKKLTSFSTRYLHQLSRTTTPSNPFNTDTHYNRPYQCTYPNCQQSFSSQITFNLHKKTHKMFPEYYQYKEKIMLGYDLDIQQMKNEIQHDLLSQQNLPLLIESEIQLLRHNNTSSTSGATATATATQTTR